MRMRTIMAATSLTSTALVLTLAPAPASAAISATSSGTVVTVTMTGDTDAPIDCSGANVRVAFITVAPAVACTALTQVTFNGDAGGQIVRGADLGAAAFTANPRLVANLGDGPDVLFESDVADQIDMGPGDDYVGLEAAGPNNAFVTMGAGTGDRVALGGTTLNDTITATSSSTSLSIALSNSGGATTRTATGLEDLSIASAAGNDTITTTGVTAASSIDFMSTEGGTGDDTLTDGPVNSYLYGGAGTNALSAGAGADAYWTQSDTDVLTDASDSDVDYVYDGFGLRSGGRTMTGFTSIDVYSNQTHEGDGVARIRPGTPAGSALATFSLTRTGQQQVPASVGRVTVNQAYSGALTHVGLVDVVAVNQAVDVGLPNSGQGILDVTIPSGTWTVLGTATNPTITSSFGTITSARVDALSVHGPWTDKRRGFMHRITRDLMFRFASESDLTEVADALAAGTSTRGDVADTYLDLPEYRGLDVDRTFVKYLRRTSDPGGRTYWINSLGNGKALWRFRAQLFGSNEYFTKAGGSNASYVTRAYSDVLGRAPDPSGQAYWTNKLNGGADRGSVALQFINSAEARRRLVDDQFLRFLDRKPTPAEQTTWVNALPSDTGERDLIRFLVTSTAYYNRS